MRPALVVAVALACGLVVFVLVRRGTDGLPYLALPAAVLVFRLAWQRRMRRDHVVDAFGVDKPLKGRRYGWAEVTHVEKPGAFDDTVVLGLTDGGTARTMFPAHLAPRFAELGRVPLRG